MERHIEKVAGGKLQITFILSVEETARFEAKALRHLAESTNLSGFRPGKAPADVVRSKAGPEALDQETMLQAVQQLYPEFIKKEDLEVIGRPQIDLVSKSPFTIKLIVATLPQVTLKKWEKIKVTKKPVKVEAEDIEKVINDIRETRVAEAAVTRAPKIGDKVEIDFTVSVDKVVVDGGSATKYPVVLGKSQLIPGFEDNIVGMEVGATKEFEVNFPKDYLPKLAGKKAQVQVKLHQVFDRILPELTDAFATSLGTFTSVEDLRKKINDNLLADEEQQEEVRVESAMLEELLKVAEFGEVPEILVNNEVEKMMHELAHSIGGHGLPMEQYLQNIKKTEEDLRKDFIPQAEKRVKVALLIRSLAKENSLAADDMAVEQEINEALEHYHGDERAAARLQSEEYRDYIQSMLTNQKVMKWLKEKLIVSE